MVNIETASESDNCMVKQRYVNRHRFIQIRLINTYIWYKWSWCKTMYWIHRSWFRSIKQIMKVIWYYIDSWSFALESDISMVKQWHVNQSYRISVIKGFDGTEFCIRIREKLGFSHGPARGAGHLRGAQMAEPKLALCCVPARGAGHLRGAQIAAPILTVRQNFNFN